ncbi:MAG: hypothetical protein LBF27_28085 [Sphingobacterium sp.]|jgi:hypothetical protein|nr:hypothetical protein [Sphingobacterium sp.]
MKISHNDPKSKDKSENEAKKEEKELRKEGNAFANTADTRPLSKAIVQEEKKNKTEANE